MTPPAASAPSSSGAGILNDEDEAALRSQLRKSLNSLQQREPLDLTYKHLLFDNVVTSRRPTLPKDKMYKNIGANLRETVTRFTENPWDKIARREPMEEDKMRAAFTLREHKKHEQEALLAATLAARQSGNYSSKKRKFEGMAMTLQRKRPKKKPKAMSPAQQAATNQADEEARRLQAERQRQAKLAEQQKKREAAHLRRLEEERREEEERIARMQESPQQKLARLCQPIFQKMWDMEFPLLQNTNPFRIVIDENNCAAMGAPDYMDIISKPMNLSYISDKISNAKYDTLKEFFDDAELMFSNAFLYNSDPNNAYHIAAKEMRKVYKKEAKAVIDELRKMAKK